MLQTIQLYRDGVGTIDLCLYQNCGFRCCRFDQGNYIVLFPDEWEAAQAAGSVLSHLQIIDDDYHGGKRAVCQANDALTCDNGYKPLDCASYPLFPKRSPNGTCGDFVKGAKCPLRTEHLADHAPVIQQLWHELLESHSPVSKWLEKVELVGYVSFDSSNGTGPRIPDES